MTAATWCIETQKFADTLSSHVRSHLLLPCRQMPFQNLRLLFLSLSLSNAVLEFGLFIYYITRGSLKKINLLPVRSLFMFLFIFLGSNIQVFLCMSCNIIFVYLFPSMVERNFTNYLQTSLTSNIKINVYQNLAISVRVTE